MTAARTAAPRMSESRQRSNQRRLSCVLGFAYPICCTMPIAGFSPCAGIAQQAHSWNGEVRAAAASHTCGTLGVLESLIDDIEVDSDQIRIKGDSDVLEQVVLTQRNLDAEGSQMSTKGRRRDSNSCRLDS
jgi:hypothetical protein